MTDSELHPYVELIAREARRPVVTDHRGSTGKQLSSRLVVTLVSWLFFFNVAATTENYTLPLHNARPRWYARDRTAFVQTFTGHGWTTRGWSRRHWCHCRRVLD